MHQQFSIDLWHSTWLDTHRTRIIITSWPNLEISPINNAPMFQTIRRWLSYNVPWQLWTKRFKSWGKPFRWISVESEYVSKSRPINLRRCYNAGHSIPVGSRIAQSRDHRERHFHSHTRVHIRDRSILCYKLKPVSDSKILSSFTIYRYILHWNLYNYCRILHHQIIDNFLILVLPSVLCLRNCVSLIFGVVVIVVARGKCLRPVRNIKVEQMLHVRIFSDYLCLTFNLFTF